MTRGDLSPPVRGYCSHFIRVNGPTHSTIGFFECSEAYCNVRFKAVTWIVLYFNAVVGSVFALLSPEMLHEF